MSARCRHCGLRLDQAAHWRVCVPKRDWPEWMRVPKQRTEARAALTTVLELLDALEAPEADTETVTLAAVYNAMLADAGEPEPLLALLTAGETLGTCCPHFKSVHADSEWGGSPLCMACPEETELHAFVARPDVVGPVSSVLCDCGYAAKTQSGLRRHRVQAKQHQSHD